MPTDINGETVVRGNESDGSLTTNIRKIEGTISTANSHSETLLADQSFTGDAEDITNVAAIFINIYSDKASSTDGLNIQQSSDGTNWDHTDTYTVPAGTGKNYNINPNSKYFRVVYTNGGDDQGAFRLQTIFKSVYSTPSSHRLGDTIRDDDDSQLVKSVISVQTNDEDTYKNVDVQNPLPTDGDSVYAKDLDLTNSITTGWTSINDGTIGDLFGEFDKGITFAGSDNPKSLTIQFRRSVITTGGMGIVTSSGNFSNTKVIAVQQDGTESTLADYSADDTDRTILPIQFTPTGFASLRFEFHTADAISLTTIFIPKASTTISRIQAISDLDDTVENINSFRNAIKVDTALVHYVGISEHAKQNLDGSTTLDVDATSGDTLINVASTTNFEEGSLLTINGTTAERSHFHVTAVSAGVSLTLNRPLDNNHLVGAVVQEVEIGMNVTSSLASPNSFKIQPPSNERWQITRLMTTMLDDSSMDDGKFGGIDALPNGVVIRLRRNGSTQTLTHWKSNADLKDDMYDVTYSDRAPAGQFGLSSRWTFTKAQFVADLEGSTGDYLEVLTQDNLSGLLDFEIKGQGRLFGG